MSPEQPVVNEAETNRVAVFVDVQNLYHAAKTFASSKVNYKMLLTKILNGRPASMCRAYAAHKDLSSSKRFYKSLEATGFNVLSKRIFTKTVEHDKKVSIPQYFEVELATDAMETVLCDDSVTTVVLCTGNGAYGYLVNALRAMDINVQVWGFDKATASSLREKAQFVPIPQDCLMPLKAAEPEEDAQ